MSEAPAALWFAFDDVPTLLHVEAPSGAPGAVRYVRADLYEAALARLAVVRSWNEAPCLEPLASATMRSGAAEGRF